MRSTLPRRAADGSRPLSVLLLALLAVGLAACGDERGASPSNGTSASTGASVGTPTASTSTAPATTAPTDGPGTASPALLDACSLLSPIDEVEAIVGIKLDSDTSSGGGWSVSDCVWNAATGSFILSVGTGESFLAFGDPGATDAKARLAQFRTEMSAAGPTRDVSDLGDGAVLAAGAMAAYRAGTYVEIQNLGLTDDQLARIMKLVIAQV